MNGTLSSNEQLIKQWNRDWQRLSEFHKRQGNLPPQDDLSSYILSFPLSFIVKKCYDYAPLARVADAHVPYVFDKLRYFMEFQVIFLRYGYSTWLHDEYLHKKVMPHHRIILKWNGSSDSIDSRYFQNAAIAFLSEPFLLDKQSRNSDNKEYGQDVSVVNSIHINSSIWVIGPFIPTTIP